MLEARRATLEALGCVVEDAEPDFEGADEAFEVLRGVTFAGAFKEIVHQVKPTLAENVRFGLSLTPERIARALELRGELFTRMRAFLERYDAFAAPVTQVPPFSVDEEFPRAIAGVEMGSYLEWFRSCSRITVTVAPGDRGPGRLHRRTGCRSGCSSSGAIAARRRCWAGARLHRRDRARRRAGRSSDALADDAPDRGPPRRVRRRRAAPVLAAPRRRTRRPALDGVTDADLCIVGGGFTGLWAALHAKAAIRRATSSLLEAETAGFGASGRNGGFCVASLTHGIENGLARFAEEMDVLERLGLENFDGLAADLDAPRHRLRLRADRRAGSRSPTTTSSSGSRRSRSCWRASATRARCSTRPAMRAEVASPTYVGGLWVQTGAAVLDPGKLAFGLREAALRARRARLRALRRARPARGRDGRRGPRPPPGASARAASCSPRAPIPRCCARSGATSSRSTTTC